MSSSEGAISTRVRTRAVLSTPISSSTPCKIPQTDEGEVLPQTDSTYRCAIGAALDTRSHPDLPVPLPEFFAKRAKVLLELELDEPQVATVQGLAILSNHEAAYMRDTRAWLFSGAISSQGISEVTLTFDSHRHGGKVSLRPWVAH